MAAQVKLRDSDGDIWVEVDGGWLQPETDSWLPTRELVEHIWGPVSEVAE